MTSQSQQSYEQQVTCLTSQVATLESECERIRSERSLLHSDLVSSRDLNAKCESSKDAIARKLTAKTVEFEQVIYFLSNVQFVETYLHVASFEL